MSIFKDLVIDKLGSAVKNPGIPFLYSSKMNAYLNSIEQGKMYVIGGRESGGKRSFVDLHFVLGAYMAWYTIPEDIRPPLKILYFNMDKSIQTKMQKWLCTYLFLAYGEFIDINTLSQGKSRMYELNPDIMNKIEASQAFFDYMIDSGVLRIFDGAINPTGLFSKSVEVILESGYVDKEHGKKTFHHYPGMDRQITLIVVDNVDKLSGESKAGEYLNTSQVHDVAAKYFSELKSVYKATPIVIVPTFKISGISLKKDMIPDFREFGQYYRPSDVAINCFNPGQYLATEKEWYGYDYRAFRSNLDKISRLRTVHVLRNVSGVDNLTIPYTMYPENGIFEECPYPGSIEYASYIDGLQTFKTNIILSKQ